MSNIVLNWTSDNLIDVGILFGFFLGLFVSSLWIIADEVIAFFKNKRRDSNKK